MACGDKQIMQTPSQKEVDRILSERTLKIIALEYNNQHGRIKREHRNPTLVAYAEALQRKTEYGSTTKNMATSRQSKRPCVVLYGANNTFPKIREIKRQNRYPSVTKLATEEQETQTIESVDFETFNWRDKLQETTDETSNKLNVTITANNLK